MTPWFEGCRQGARISAAFLGMPWHLYAGNSAWAGYVWGTP